jgi:ribose transport system substrate-binding protein
MKSARSLPTFVFALFLAACGQRDRPSIDSITANKGPTPPTRARVLKVAFIMKSLTNPFFIEMAKGAREAQRERGIELNVQASTPETSVEQQIRMVDSQIEARVDAIVISPVDTRRLVPVLKKAQDAGIKIVNADERLQPDAVAVNGMRPVPFVGVDNERGAYLGAKFLAAKVHQPTQACILEGIPGTFTAIDRKRGIEKAFAENGNLEIVATAVANWNADEAYEAAKGLFRTHPNIGVVYCANDMMAIGLIKYLQERGRTAVLVGGYDAVGEAREALRAGRLSVTVDQRADRQGYISVMSALKLLGGEPVPDTVLVDTEVVTGASRK